MRVVIALVGLGLAALMAAPASASPVPPTGLAVAGDAFLSILGVSGLAALTARSERWRSAIVTRSR